MVTPLGLLVAIIVACLVLSALMIFLMIAESPSPAWCRRLNISSVVFGVLMVAFGVLQFSIGRKAEETGRPSYYRTAPVTPAQSYAAGVGFVILGIAATVVAVVHRKKGPDDASTRPTI